MKTSKWGTAFRSMTFVESDMVCTEILGRDFNAPFS